MLEDKDFEVLEDNTPETDFNLSEDDVEITADDFTLTQIDETVHEQKFQTKPTTFLKDSLKRFSKNKSSVVAGYILGALLLMSFLVPVIDTNKIEPHPEEIYLAPKLFDAGTGFWDGTEKYTEMAVDISEMPNAQTEEEKQLYWWPSKEIFEQRSAISNKKFTGLKYKNTYSNYSHGKEGYIQFGYYYDQTKDKAVDFSSNRLKTLTLDNDLYLSVFDTYDVDKINAREQYSEKFGKPENYELGESALYFNYTDTNGDSQEVQLTDYKTVHNIGSAVASYAEPKVNIADKIVTETGIDTFKDAYFSVRMLGNGQGHNTCSLIGGIAFESTSDTIYETRKVSGDKEVQVTVKEVFDEISFTDATDSVIKVPDDKFEYWSSTGVRRIYLSKGYYCSFTYDTYEAAYGVRYVKNFSIFKLLEYEEKGWMSFEDANGFPTLYQGSNNSFVIDTVNFSCKILNAKKCPITEPLTLDDFHYDTPNSAGKANNAVAGAMVSYYKYLEYDTMPRFLMGTDKNGYDMFKYVFEGLRTSLLLGVLTFVVCFLFGLLWGSICGYFGGTVDLVMERITDILSGIPWIVLMTLIIIHWGSNFATFAIALCMTGWIGTAARTRTQFYRFRGREYVLASRTLGASDARLIAKHILPNALGTIITGAVLMIPSVIFSEATISYLGLGLKNISSLGVILSNNQSELLTSPYLLIFPSVVIALIMISFNLFGNGLRDAINPSLKGEDQ